METSLHTLIDIFDYEFDIDEEKVKLQKIEIPIIQRDYAQGRNGNEIKRVRDRFLDALLGAVKTSPITLDFVYGDIDKNGTMTPLDGQQRLTTLFLLHWYAAKKEGIPKEDYAFLNNFTYETRYSSREFCGCLVNYDPDFSENLKEQIIDQYWFPLDWNNDPTISSMLVMIESISAKFSDVDGLWDRLKQGAVSFYVLPIRDMGLTDELYIKMNSRGKPLTMFEHFKAEFERELSKIYEKKRVEEIIRKIDIDWTDMLWIYRGDDNVIDDEFLRYFRFICDIICYHDGGTPQGKDYDEFDLLEVYFNKDNPEIDKNVDYLIKCFDSWCEIKKTDVISSFFDKYVTSEAHEPGKIVTHDKVDFFEDCLRTYGEVAGNGNRLFTLGKTVILYAFQVYVMHRDSVTEDDFRRRIRVIRNLVDNSEDEISDSESRSGGNRMPAILKQVDSIITNGIICEDIDINFNAFQLSEEKEKLEWTKEHPELAESLYNLEDYYLLHGQIGIVGLDHPEFFDRFITLFDNCNRDKIDCALMASGCYIQRDRRGSRYQSGSGGGYNEPWNNLFHKSGGDWYENTQETVQKLLSESQPFTDEMLDAIGQEYISKCENNSLYDWRYYYLKYSEFRPQRYGKYIWENYDEEPYCMVALWTQNKMSENAYQPFLKAVDKMNRISRDDLGQFLVYDNTYLACSNDSFVVKRLDNNEEVRRIVINQNEEGIDTEDRIRKYLELDIPELV